ncbi:chaplin [Streptomyces mexicanus]|uniref:chaplin n=1 Tax=Streptomyces mexicanus TaxID=178566 RepID=UPI001F45F29B|nr:chaplin [Streptomyces mexicanus]
MRQTLSRGVFAAAAATSVLSLYGSPAFADSQAGGAATNSAGLLSGNSVQAPIEVPVNVCGNTVDGAAALNPAFGNKCGHVSEKTTPTPSRPPKPSPGCDGYGGYGDGSSPSDDCTTPPAPPKSTPPTSAPPSQPSEPPRVHTPQEPPQLAQTGGDDTAALLATSAAAAALIAGGTILYRRGRSAGTHR